MKFLKILFSLVLFNPICCKIIGPPKTNILSRSSTKVRSGARSPFPSCSGSRSEIIGGGRSDKICNTVRECKQVCDKEECKTTYEYRKVNL